MGEAIDDNRVNIGSASSAVAQGVVYSLLDSLIQEGNVNRTLIYEVRVVL